MAYHTLAKKDSRRLGPTAPSKRHYNPNASQISERNSSRLNFQSHPLTDQRQNQRLYSYESEVKGKFDQIIPLLKKIASLQHNHDFLVAAKLIAKSELGFELPDHILEKAWIRTLDMRAMFAWCVFEAQKQASVQFFEKDPLSGSETSNEAREFQSFLEQCGFHLLDVSPCSDGRLAHSIAYALRIPFSSVRRRSYAGALFDIGKTVNRWIKTEHTRYREGSPNNANDPTRYLKVVTYHFSSLDPEHQGCAAHGSNDELAIRDGYQRLLDFRESIENSFCCGASVDLLLIGLDTDTDSLRVHVPDANSKIDLTQWISSQVIYEDTKSLSAEKAMNKINKLVEASAPSKPDPGMVSFITKLLANNISQIDYVREFYDGTYPDAGHAERFIGVGIGFKEVHLRNLTYFTHLDTVEEGSPDLDVGIKIFKGLNVSKDLPIPIVVRFDYSGKVPGARKRAVADCLRINRAIAVRYKDLLDDGLLHTYLTVRDRDQKGPAEFVGSSLDPVLQEEH